MIDRLAAGKPITVAGITLIPIVRLRIDAAHLPYSYLFNATKTAQAVVICGPESPPRVMDMEARECRLDDYLTILPELASLMKAAG